MVEVGTPSMSHPDVPAIGALYSPGSVVSKSCCSHWSIVAAACRRSAQALWLKPSATEARLSLR